MFYVDSNVIIVICGVAMNLKGTIRSPIPLVTTNCEPSSSYNPEIYLLPFDDFCTHGAYPKKLICPPCVCPVRDKSIRE